MNKFVMIVEDEAGMIYECYLEDEASMDYWGQAVTWWLLAAALRGLPPAIPDWCMQCPNK